VTLPVRGVEESQVHVLLLDIEGTTTPIDFVYKTLFPYASGKVQSFLQEHSNDAEIQALLRDLRAQHEADDAQGQRPPAWVDGSAETRLRSSVAYVQWLIAKDRKCTPLKSLQGKIWQQGFESGELHGEVYPDVPPAFARWRRQGREICIYSSGSVLAQQLLFRTVASGDLTTHIAAFFDTQMGTKTVAESYRKIATSLGGKPEEFLFVSDAAKEIEAASSSGMHSRLCERHTLIVGGAGQPGVVHSFDEILPV
jgi:enolase-phosphatase E1